MDEISKTFLERINAHQGIVHKICKMYSHGHDEAQDLFQEILMNAWKSYPRFEERSKFSTWLYKVALNTALMKLRSDRRHQNVDRMDMDTVADRGSGGVEDEDINELYRAIEKLDLIEKAIIILHLEEISYAEIAVIMGLTENHVGVKINRIKGKLRELLEKKNGK